MAMRVRPRAFSDELEAWLRSSRPKTLASLDEVFGDRSFAIIFIILMLLPALPIPTGGITHVFTIITVLLALELVIGRRTIWLPRKWKRMSLGKTLQGRVIPLMLRRVRWFERHSRPRGGWLFLTPLMPRIIGLLVAGFGAAAFFAPPFSGLDTLPSLAIVIIGLAVILNDMLLFAAGTIIGVTGIALILVLGKAAVGLLHRLV